MKRALAIIFCCVILRVSGNKEPSGQEELSQETKDTLDAILDFMACVDEGKCNPAEQNAPSVDQKVDKNVDVPISTEETIQTDHLKVPDVTIRPEAPVEKSPYFALCQKIGYKLEELESLHPELKSLKFQFLGRLDSHASGFTTDCKEGESLVTKILDLVILVAEKLKEDFAGLKHPKQIPIEEVIAEEPESSNEIGFVGSVRGIPGVHYPNYTEVPITSFSCSDKKYVPGFYADLETGCQVFHVCYEHRRESFLCPLGTIFNQPILACDYWYSSNCSLALGYYDVNAKNEVTETVEETEEIIETIVEQTKTSEIDLKNLVKFLPVKARIVEFPKEPKAQAVVSSIDGVDEVAANIFGGIISTSTKVTSNARQAIGLFPRPKPVLVFPKVMKPLPLMKAKLAVKAAAAVPIVKAKVAAAAIPVVKAKFVAAAVPIVKAKVAAAAIPVVKAKFVTAAAVPIVKAKVAAAAVPIVKAKVAAAAVPVVKAKFVAAAAVPVAKAKVAAAAVPVVKAKFVTAAAVPVAKAKIAKAAAVPFFKVKKMARLVPIVAAVKPKLVVPVMKAKLVKSAVISPLTKKALALGYLKLLKAKKLVLMG